jgi:hypothetical protein
MDRNGITATQTNREISVKKIIMFTHLEYKRYTRYRKNVFLTKCIYIWHYSLQRVLHEYWKRKSFSRLKRLSVWNTSTCEQKCSKCSPDFIFSNSSWCFTLMLRQCAAFETCYIFKENNTHTHTHTHTYIYIYIFLVRKYIHIYIYSQKDAFLCW